MDFLRTTTAFLLAFSISVNAWSAAPGRLTLAEGDYIDLRVFGAAQNMAYSWDPVAKNAVLEGQGGHFRFHVGSEYVLKNGRLEKMSGKAGFWNDSVVAPASAAPLLSGARPLPVSAPAPKIRTAAVSSGPAAVHAIRKVVVDAGHGGKDTGAISPNGLREKKVTLDVAGKVRQGLEAAGVQVVMTRSADVFIPLSERAHIANKSGADLFVSIHANASESRSLSGFETYTLSEATDDHALAVERAENSVLRFEPSARSAGSENLEAILWDLRETANRKESLLMASEITDEVSGSVPVAAKRQKSANFYVLKWTECPAVLVELAYLSHRSDERKLRDPAYRTEVADAIVRGILNYKREFEHTNGYTE